MLCSCVFFLRECSTPPPQYLETSFQIFSKVCKMFLCNRQDHPRLIEYTNTNSRNVLKVGGKVLHESMGNFPFIWLFWSCTLVFKSRNYTCLGFYNEWCSGLYMLEVKLLGVASFSTKKHNEQSISFFFWVMLVYNKFYK